MTPRTADDFRLRGARMTRLETFCDAAFAFALTMLVISIEAIPGNLAELIVALKGAPAFAASFAQIMIFWAAHRTWSRRYGLDEGWAVVLSCLLIFVVLVYVYPLKIIFGAFFAWMSDGWLTRDFQISSVTDFTPLFTIFSVGFTAMSASIVLLNLYAWSKRDTLGLNALERHASRWEIIGWLTVVLTGVVATALALILPAHLAMFSGFFYSTFGISMPLLAHWKKAARARI